MKDPEQLKKDIDEIDFLNQDPAKGITLEQLIRDIADSKYDASVIEALESRCSKEKLKKPIPLILETLDRIGKADPEKKKAFEDKIKTYQFGRDDSFRNSGTLAYRWYQEKLSEIFTETDKNEMMRCICEENIAEFISLMRKKIEGQVFFKELMSQVKNKLITRTDKQSIAAELVSYTVFHCLSMLKSDLNSAYKTLDDFSSKQDPAVQKMLSGVTSPLADGFTLLAKQENQIKKLMTNEKQYREQILDMGVKLGAFDSSQIQSLPETNSSSGVSRKAQGQAEAATSRGESEQKSEAVSFSNLKASANVAKSILRYLEKIQKELDTQDGKLNQIQSYNIECLICLEKELARLIETGTQKQTLTVQYDAAKVDSHAQKIFILQHLKKQILEHPQVPLNIQSAMTTLAEHQKADGKSNKNIQNSALYKGIVTGKIQPSALKAVASLVGHGEQKTLAALQGLQKKFNDLTLDNSSRPSGPGTR